MDQTARRRRRNLIQNIAIALLSVSAVLLFAQLQLYNLGTSEDPLYLERLTGEGSPSRLREFPAPVRVVLTDSYGRYGSLGFTTNSDGFSALGLREALGSVQHLAPSATDAFRGALSGPSIYFDFLNPLPLQVLAELTGAEGTALEGNARCLLLAAGADGSVHLYVWDGADTVLTGTVASTALSIDSLTEAVSQSGMGSVSFAFEVVEMEPLYGKLFPLSILPTELPQLPVLSAASSISGTDWLLAAFGFNINTRERYAEADGTEVITEVEADRSLHIRPSGEITYRSGTDATLEISAQEEVPTAAEAVLGASILLEQLTEDRNRSMNRLHREMKIYFPEYKDAFGKIDGAFCMAVLKEAPFPEDILKLGAEGIREIWRQAKLRGRGYSRAAKIVKYAETSVGLKDGREAGKEAARWFAEKIMELDEELAETENSLNEKCREIPHAENVLEIPGIGGEILSGILAEMGDVSRFDDAKELQKLSGLGLVSCSSGKHKGETRISHRGRKRLRYWLFQAARSAVAHGEEYKWIHAHYTTRAGNPLQKMQSLIVIACKILRVIYTMLKTGKPYDSEKLLKDIRYPENVQTAAA